MEGVLAQEVHGREGKPPPTQTALHHLEDLGTAGAGEGGGAVGVVQLNATHSIMYHLCM